jgi:hypothetical protein
MFWNKTKTAEPEAVGSDTNTYNMMLGYAKPLALHIMEEMKIERHKQWLSNFDPRELEKISEDVVEPAERILHVMALQMAATVYIAHAANPRVALRTFVEGLEKEVVKACRGMGRSC